MLEMLLVVVLNVLVFNSDANIISFINFSDHDSNFIHKIWGKYLDNINYHMVRKAKSFQPKSLVFFRYLEINVSVKIYLKFMQLMTNCNAGQNLYIKTIVGKICDIYLYNSTYPIRKYPIYPTKYSNWDRIRFLEECFIAKHFLRIKLKNFKFELHKRLQLNVTLLRVDVELSYRCRTEYIGKGMSYYYVKRDRICGKLPQMSYLFGHTAILRMQVLIEKSLHRIELNFQVFDPAHVKPMACCQKCSSLVSESNCYHLGSRTSYQEPNHTEYHLSYYLHGVSNTPLGMVQEVFLILLKRTSHLSLKFETDHIWTRVYDGPYMMPRFLVAPKNNLIYKFSTFQGIHLQTYNSTPGKSIQLKYAASSYISKCVCPLQQLQLKTFANEGNSTALKQCQGGCKWKKNETSFCVLEFQAESNYHVNITFNSLGYHGPNIDNCRFGGVTVFDGERPVTVLCDTYSQKHSDRSSKVPMNIVSTGSKLTLVLHSYLDDIKVSFSFQEVTCAGIFIDPCAIQIIQGNNPINIELFSFHYSKHHVKNNYLLQHCDSGTYSKTHYLKFTLNRMKPCVVFQVFTPQWIYKMSFLYHCKVVVFQNHANDNNVLQYTIKSYQSENVMVSPHDAPLKTINKHDQCHSALHHGVEQRELPGYGDIITFHFHGAQTVSHSHKISGQWCNDISSYIRVYHTPRCDLRILSKSHNSTLLHYFSILESPMKMDEQYIKSLGTLSARLLAWGPSWISMKVALKSRIAEYEGQISMLPPYDKLSTCKFVQNQHRKSILKLILEDRNNNQSNCFLGELGVKLKFENLCEPSDRDPTAILIRVKLWRSMFLNNNYYLYVPMNYHPFYPVLNYDTHSGDHRYFGKSCQNTDLSLDWLIFDLPETFHKETLSCQASDIGKSAIVGHSVDVGWLEPVKFDFDLYEYDDDGNWVAKDQTEVFEKFLREGGAEDRKKRITHKPYYKLMSYRLNAETLGPFSWSDAAKKCSDKDSQMVTIHSIRDLKVLLAHVAKSFYEERIPLYAIYTGLHRRAEHKILQQGINNGSSGYQLWRNNHYGGVNVHYNVFPQQRPSLKFKAESLQHVALIENLLQNTSWTLQPEQNPDRRCSLLLFSNILHPEMIMVNCREKLANNMAVCVQFKDSKESEPTHDIHCPVDAIFVSATGRCYTTFHKDKNEFPQCTGSELWDLNMTNSDQEWPILEAMAIIKQTDISYIFTKGKKMSTTICKLLTISYSPLYILESLPHVWYERPCNEISSLYMCSTSVMEFEKQSSKKLSNIFPCDDNTYISTMLLCDGVSDCVDGTDESFCKHQCEKDTQIVTRYKRTNRGNALSNSGCLLWQDKTGTCKTHISSSHHGKSLQFEIDTVAGAKDSNYRGLNHTNNFFICNKYETISTEFINDTIPDCMNGEDELEYKELLTNSEHKAKFNTCTDPTMLPCIPGHSRCFKRSELCLYQRHPVHSYLRYCRNGAHLAQCEKFSCNGDFKCPGYYCVHISHICDGVMDCPNGDDESNCKGKNCTRKFRCKDTKTCTHIHEICDGILHCLHGDDELACDIQSCWDNCQCLNYAIHCQQSDITTLQTWVLLPYLYVSFEGSHMSDIFLSEFLQRFPGVLFMHLNNNFLTDICHIFRKLPSLLQLNFKMNRIKHLRSACFADLEHLVQLTLKHNTISTIEAYSFLNLDNLTLLDLSHNQLSTIHDKSFSHLTKLSFLDISRNPILTINIISLEILFPILKIIQTDDFRICCLVKTTTVNCEVKPAWPSSCGNILSSSILRNVLLFAISVVISINFLCLVGHVFDTFNETKNKHSYPRSRNLKCGYNSIVILINTSEIVFASYLLLIFVMDFIYGGNFSNFERYWRKSLVCHFISFVHIFSSFMSIFSVTLLALTRNRMITNPMYTPFSKQNTILQIIIFGTGTILFISVTLTISYRFVEKNVFQSNSLCLLIGNLGDSTTIKFTTGFLAVVELCGIILNISLYTHLLTTLFRQSKELTVVTGKEGSNVHFSTVIQLLLVGVSNIFCWAPGGILNITALSIKVYPIKALLWITTVARPLNGVVNPIVFNYGLVAKFFKGKLQIRDS